MREPAYCDRILWHDYNTHLATDHSSHYTGVGLQQLTYEKCKNNISDHKPVVSMFKVTVEWFVLRYTFMTSDYTLLV